MGHCKDCAWWHSIRYPDQQGECDLPQLMTSQKERDDMAKSKSHFGITVEVADGHGLSVELLTGPEFGCVQYAERQR